MTESFDIYLFYPDGEAPESGKQAMADLSEKWFSICSGILAHYGPVFNHNMGNTLSRFDIRMTGPVGQLLVDGHVCFDFVVSLGSGSAQDTASVHHFQQILDQVTFATGKSNRADVKEILAHAPACPMLLIFDCCTPEVENAQKGALMDLGVHLAGAYYRYCETKQTQG